VGHSKLDRRIGRNETFNHSGNVLAATLAAIVGQFISRKGIFFLVGAMAAGSAISARSLRYQEIDNELARGGGDGEDDNSEDQDKSSGTKKLFGDRRVLMFCIAVVLFHFANAAMLPLVGQRLARGHHGLDPTVYMSACIIVAQLVMTPTASIVGRLSEGGRKPIFLLGFAVLPIRGVLYTLSNNPYFLVSVQILDGIAGGIFGVLSILVVADLTRGTGRFNLIPFSFIGATFEVLKLFAGKGFGIQNLKSKIQNGITQGALNTAIGIGAGLSNLLAGFVVQKAGYNFGFLMLAAIAIVATGVFWFLVPETKAQKTKARRAAIAP
jgi:predicted MFS family arabinose efflux permease